MLHAALDTSNGCAFAVKRDGQLIIDAFLDGSGRDSDRLLAPWLKDQLAAYGCTLKDVGFWTTGLGPGSFAGLRCGIAIVKGICLASQAKLRGEPSALAVAAMSRDIADGNKIIGVLNDGRCGQLILTRVQCRSGRPAALDGAPQPLAPEQLLEPDFACDAWITIQADKLHQLPEAVSARLQSEVAYSAAPLLDLDDGPWPETLEDTEKSCTPLYVRPPVFVQPAAVRKL